MGAMPRHDSKGDCNDGRVKAGAAGAQWRAPISLTPLPPLSLQAVEAVQQIRPCINLRLGLQDQLRQWEDSLGLSRYSKRPLKNRQPLKGDFCEIQIQLPRLRRT